MDFLAYQIQHHMYVDVLTQLYHLCSMLLRINVLCEICIEFFYSCLCILMGLYELGNMGRCFISLILLAKMGIIRFIARLRFISRVSLTIFSWALWQEFLYFSI